MFGFTPIVRDIMDGLREPIWKEEEFNVPNVDLYEKENEYVAEVEAPGLDKNSITVEIQEGSILSIKGERKDSKEETKKGKYYVKECFYGSFLRQIALPDLVDENNIKASVENGILKIVIPKMPKKEAKKIEVK